MLSREGLGGNVTAPGTSFSPSHITPRFVDNVKINSKIEHLAFKT